MVANAFASIGFSADASQVIYPVNMFIPGSDLTPIEQKMDALIAGLTKWVPKIEVKGTITPPKIRVEGNDYEEAIVNVNKLFLQNRWGDGLPITPPTERLVNWLLTGTNLPRDKVVARILPRGGIATVETIAVNLGMAGGRPEYLPVLLAAVEAITAPASEHHRMNTTTCSVYPVVIVNGPITKQIRLGSGYGCLGPDPLNPAGASIGRAIRLLLQDAGGALPGIGTMSIFGGPARYTNIIFAEDEDGMPHDWEPLNVEQGFLRGSSTVTSYAVSSTSNILGTEAGDEQSVSGCLNRIAAFIGVPNANYWLDNFSPEGAAGILLMACGTAQGLSKLGWSKDKVKTFLWENSKVPFSKIGSNVYPLARDNIKQDPMPISVNPRGIKIVVAGGLQSQHAMWLQVGCCPERLTSAEIKLPSNWDDLLNRSEEDMGASIPLRID